ncbi:hypothetical protein [Polaromonas sp.]|nr:hypothetical protein [Polaromonas sp.]
MSLATLNVGQQRLQAMMVLGGLYAAGFLTLMGISQLPGHARTTHCSR